MAPPRPPRSSEDSSSLIGTIGSTSSSSTVPGPGAITGKFLKLLGEKSLDLVVFVIIRNRLKAIERTLEKSPHVFRNPTGDKEQKRLNDAYNELREICLEVRSDYYPLSFQRAAARLTHDITMMRRPVEQSSTIDASPAQTWEALLLNVQHLLPPQGPEPQGLELQGLEPRDRTRKVLVLGAGDVGKSTSMKQIQDASMHDTETYQDAIIKDTIVSLFDIVSDLKPSDFSEAYRNTFQQTKDAVQRILDGRSSDHAHAIGGAIWLLWQDPAVRRAVRRSKLGMLSDEHAFESIDYFLESAYRIFKSDYMPDHEDIVRCCIRTTGIWETKFLVKENPWVMIDTGGQRALSEDPSVNRMNESLTLFESIANSPRFTNTLIVLLFNKFDLFVEKLPIEPLKDYFPDYTGVDVDDACKYFARRFLSVVKDKARSVVVEYGTAINTEGIRVIFQSIQNEINQHYERNIDIL